MAADNHLKVFVASGYYDIAIPLFVTEYTLDHLRIEPELKSNIEMRYYEAGHMMHIHEPSLVKLKEDLQVSLQNQFDEQKNHCGQGDTRLVW